MTYKVSVSQSGNNHIAFAETAVSNGIRYIPIRECQFTERIYLDTAVIAHDAEAALKEARLQERDNGADWTEDNPVVAIATVSLKVLQIDTLAVMPTAD